MSQRKTKTTNSQSHTHMIKTGVRFIAMQAPQCFWIMNAASPKLCKLHHTAELKPSPALTSLPFSASITQVFASVWSTRCKSFFFFLKKHPKLQNQGTVVSSGSCIRRQYVVSRKLAAGILFVPAVCKTNTAAHCIHSQPPKCRSLVYHSSSSSSSFKILHTAGYYRKVLLFYFNKTQRPSCGLLSAVAGAEVCWMVSR